MFCRLYLNKNEKHKYMHTYIGTYTQTYTALNSRQNNIREERGSLWTRSGSKGRLNVFQN